MTGIEFNRHIEKIPIYPAASTYAFEGELVKLASNETPYAPHPQVLEAVEAQLRTLNRYPDPEKSLLRRRISERTGVPIGNVAVGNGSCEILLAAAAAMLEPGAEIVYAWPSFSMYPQLAAMSGATAVTVPLNDAGEHDLEAMAAQVTAATRLVIVCNPNNPTSTAVPADAIAAACAAALQKNGWRTWLTAVTNSSEAHSPKPTRSPHRPWTFEKVRSRTRFVWRLSRSRVVSGSSSVLNSQ